MVDATQLLSDFASTRDAPDPEAERHTFFCTLQHNPDWQAAVFAALSATPTGGKSSSSSLPPPLADAERTSLLLQLLLAWLRHDRDFPPDDEPGQGGRGRNLALQYLPQVILLSYACRQKAGVPSSSSTTNATTTTNGQVAGSDQRRRLGKSLDAFLVAVYNAYLAQSRGKSNNSKAATDVAAAWQQQRLPWLGHASIYHDPARLQMDGVESTAAVRASSAAHGGHDAPHGYLVLQSPGFRQVPAVNAQNRPRVVEGLLQLCNGLLGRLSRQALDHYLQAAQALLQRGPPSSSANTAQRKGVLNAPVPLSANILLELLHAAYFCIYNGFKSRANAVVEQIRHRGSAAASPQVLLAVNAIRTLSLTSSPSQANNAAASAMSATAVAAGATTPSQIAKNMITNASFRAKKMGDDIPKVLETPPAGAAPAAASAAAAAPDNTAAIANNLKVLANMSSISEEIVEEIMEKAGPLPKDGKEPAAVTTSTHASGGKAAAAAAASKIKAKLPNVSGLRKRLSESEGDKTAAKNLENAKKSEKKEQHKTSIQYHADSDSVKIAGKGAERRKDKTSRGAGSSSPGTAAAANANSAAAPAAANAELTVANNSSHAEIDSIEKVEALIQMKRLPAETVTIHSPESGTTIF